MLVEFNLTSIKQVQRKEHLHFHGGGFML